MPYSLISLSEDILSIAFTKRTLFSWDRQIGTALGHPWSHYASGNECDPLDEVIWQQHLGHNIDCHTLPFRHTFGTHYKEKIRNAENI
jgi:hypothetical protein